MIKLVLKNRAKVAQFTTIFMLLKACSEMVCIVIMADHVHIQVMDKSHICLCECRLFFTWFDNADEDKLGETVSASFVFSSGIFHTILNSIGEQTLIMEFEEGEDVFKVSAIYDTPTKENINKYYTLPLVDKEHEVMNIPETEYNVEFTIGAKTIIDIFAQMMLFGATIRVQCDEDTMKICSSEGSNGEMRVDINTDDFEEFAIDEGLELELNYSLTHLMKYCLTTKLVPTIQFCISTTAPMKVSYNLEEAKAIVQFFIAAKVHD